jgi:uncharacterized protein (DUF885 family)
VGALTSIAAARSAVALLLLCAASACASPGTAGSVTASPPTRANAEARVARIADALVDDMFERSPGAAAAARAPGARHDRLPDESLAAVSARRRRWSSWLSELRRIDRRVLRGSTALAHAAAVEQLDSLERVARLCRPELWNGVSPLWGWHVALAGLAELQPVGTAALRRQALARFSSLPAYSAAQIDNLREGLRRGYTAARINTRQVIEQLDALLAPPAARSPYFAIAVRDGTPTFRGSFEAVVSTKINSALRRYRDFLEREYLPAAREAIGVSANPGGAACYRAWLRMWTTVDRSPQELHATGERQLAKIEAEMSALARAAFGEPDVRRLRERLRSDPAYRYRGAEDVVARSRAAIERARAAMPRAFLLVPKAQLVIEPIPAFQEKSSAPHYSPAAVDGTRPAAYRVRLYQPRQQSWVTAEVIAFHETIPGHHLQSAITAERRALPRVLRLMLNPGYREGWALYAERLADELGLYSDDASRMGMLASEALRAVRLVVDTGIHAMGWGRQRAIDLLRERTAVSEEQAAAEVDRYVAHPGQATAYLVGALELRALRARARQQLGARFELRAFHDRVLESGNVPLTVLREHVERWIAQERVAGAR